MNMVIHNLKTLFAVSNIEPQSFPVGLLHAMACFKPTLQGLLDSLCAHGRFIRPLKGLTENASVAHATRQDIWPPLCHLGLTCSRR